MEKTKKSLVGEAPVSDAALARDILDDLIRYESRGHGDADNALRRLGAIDDDVPYGFLWNLKYKPPERVQPKKLRGLLRLHAYVCERLLRKLEHDLERTREIAGSLDPAVVAAEAVLRQAKKARGEP